MSQFNPALQVQYCRNEKRVHTGKAPSLALMGRAYGFNISQSWLEIQLEDLSEFAGVKEKLKQHQIAETARRLSEMYGYWKLTEFMLFFSRFKNCHYGKFWGVVDPMVIIEAAHKFQKERVRDIQRYEDEQRAEETRRLDNELDEIKARFSRRVPGAWTSGALIDFTQYRLMGYDCMNDEEFANELALLMSGAKKIPKEAMQILNLCKIASNGR